MDRAVLVVDEAVGMAVIGRRDQAGSGREVVVAPWAKIEFGRQVDAGTAPVALEQLHHKVTTEKLESGLTEDLGMCAGWMKQQLRLDAIDVGGVEQRFKEVTEQS